VVVTPLQCIAPPIAFVNGFSDLLWHPNYEKGAWVIGADSRRLHRYFRLSYLVLPGVADDAQEIHKGE